MRMTRLRATSDLVHRAFNVTGEVLRETRALRRGVKRMPKPVPWDWAAPRLLPIFSGPSLDGPGEPLIRLFGDHDQILGTPSESCLVSLPMDTPSHIVADILVDFERGTLRPLWLDPFIVSNRQISWSDDVEARDDDDRW